jgi:hypothetical protein
MTDTFRALCALALLIALGAVIELCVQVIFVRLLPLLLRLTDNRGSNV